MNLDRTMGSRLAALVIALGGIVLHAQQAGLSFDVATTRPLDVARVMANRYPSAPSMSYIPAMAWSGALRLSGLTGETRWAEKAKSQMRPFLAGEQPVTLAQTSLASLGGHIAFADLALAERDERAVGFARASAELLMPHGGDEVVRFATGWTDDMYMASAQLVRVAALTGDARFARAASRLLVTYAGKLQRPDGLFIHAASGPHAWGRGNGFASLGLADALQYMPPDTPDRARVLEIFRTHMAAVAKVQSDDGTWRQVLDEPTSYRELTSTALFLATMARGVRLGWLDTSLLPIIDRAWAGLLARVAPDGTLRDVCSSTGAAPAREHYLNRPITNGADDRGGAMVLLAALELEQLRRR